MAAGAKSSALAAWALALVSATGLAGCSAGSAIDTLPAAMGEPAGTPARPATPYEYPAVHDMPPPRPTPTMTEEQQVNLEKELTAVRERQESRDGAAKTAKKTAKPTAKTAVKPTKKKPAADGQVTGAKTNP